MSQINYKDMNSNELMKYKKVHLVKTVKEAGLWEIDDNNKEVQESKYTKSDLVRILIDNKQNNTTLYLSAEDINYMSEEEDEEEIVQ